MAWFCCACTPQYYRVTTDPGDISKVQKDWQTAPDLSPTRVYFESRAILIPEAAAQDQVMAETISLIQARKYGKIKGLLKASPTSHPYRSFCQGLRYFFKKQYTQAHKHFKADMPEELIPMAAILRVDCHIQNLPRPLTQQQKLTLTQQYQDILDRAELSAAYKKVVNDRVHVLRYE